MTRVALSDEFFQGAVAVERGEGWARPWRIPADKRDLFISPDDGLLARARESSGVRLRFETDSRRVTLDFALEIKLPDGRRDLLVAADPAFPRAITVESGGSFRLDGELGWTRLDADGADGRAARSRKSLNFGLRPS